MPSYLKKYPHLRGKYEIYKKNYYKRHRQNPENNKKVFFLDEIDLIIEHKFPDKVLGKMLGRSVQSIQVKRSKFKAKMKLTKKEKE